MTIEKMHELCFLGKEVSDIEFDREAMMSLRVEAGGRQEGCSNRNGSGNRFDYRGECYD